MQNLQHPLSRRQMLQAIFPYIVIGMDTIQKNHNGFPVGSEISCKERISYIRNGRKWTVDTKTVMEELGAVEVKKNVWRREKINPQSIASSDTSE